MIKELGYLLVMAFCGYNVGFNKAALNVYDADIDSSLTLMCTSMIDKDYDKAKMHMNL
jgi:hypothetical protein